MEQQMVRAIIVDDEAPARRYLHRQLEAIGGVDVVGDSGTLQEAVRLVTALRPHVLFLDIELNTGTGFQLFDTLPCKPHIIFVTAHTQYATQAFDIQAIDYLLKPVRPERLAQALQRLPLHQDRQSLYVRSARNTRIVQVEQLTALMANGDYVTLRSAKHTDTLIHATLKSLSGQLPTPPFLRLSRSIILNLDHVWQLRPRGNTGAEVHFDNGASPLVLGRTAARRLRQAISS